MTAYVGALLLAGCPSRPPATGSPPAPTAAPPPAAAPELLASAKRALREGRYSDADRALVTLQRTRPDLLEARLLLGQSAYAQRRYAPALAAFREVATERPHSAAAWLGLAQSYEALQRPADALTAYRTTLRLDLHSEVARQGILRLGQVKRIAVTIDDGPALTYTLRAMDAAEQYGGRLTFFVEGKYLQRDPQIVRRMAERGHQIANHSWDHPRLDRLTEAQVRDQLSRTNELIVAQGGPRPTVFRPTYGARNATVDQVAAELGLTIVMWDVDPNDWDRSRSGTQIVEHVLTHARPEAVVLLHQVRTTYTVLDRLFQGLHDQGYTCVRLDELGRWPEKSAG